MSEQYFPFCNKYYRIDLDAMSDYITGIDVQDGLLSEKTKNEQWVKNESDNELTLVSKDVTETTSSRADSYGTLRGEIVKLFLTLVLYPTIDGNGGVSEIKDFGDMTFGQTVAMNTLIDEGIIKEVEFSD